MANPTGIRIGLDPTGSDCHAAMVKKSETGTSVLSLLTDSVSGITRREELRAGPCVVSVPDEMVMVKELTLVNPGSDRKEQQVKFELRNSILDDPSLYCFDVIETCDESRCLGLLARREKLEKWWPLGGDAENSFPAPDGYIMRAVALGRSYLEFCESNDNGLVCLMDPTGSGASLCFVHQDKIVALGHLDWRRFRESSSNYQVKLAAELKTLINFRLSALAEKNITSTFSALIVSGGNLDVIDCEILANQLSVGVSLPPFKKESSFDSGENSPVLLSNYFVPLGLAVE